MEEEVMKLLEEAKPKLEKEYCVRISDGAFDLAVRGYLDPKLMISEDTNHEYKRAVEILAGACNLVQRNFRNGAHERVFYDKAYELRRALVELTELHWDSSNPASRSWASRLTSERASASLYMSGFLRKCDKTVNSPLSCCRITSKIAEILEKFDIYDTSSSEGDVGRYLDDLQGQLIELFQHLLTVEASHVAEVVSSLTDVPLTQILPSVDNHKQKAVYMTNLRVVDQKHVIDEVFETVAFQRNMTTRPRGLFLLLGDSGVGKSEIAKAVAEHWYCDASRLVEIDMSEYAECDLSEWSQRKDQDLWNRLTEIVAKRPYSVILLDKIDKGSSIVTRILHEVLSETPSDTEGKPVDFSKSIIFMTSSVGSKQLTLKCTCYNRNQDLWKQFKRDPLKFCKTHDCTVKGSGRERLLIEVRKIFSADLLDSFDKTLVVEKFRDWKTVVRLLLREIVSEVTGQRFVVHASDAALNVLLNKALAPPIAHGNALKKSLLEHVIPWLSSAESCNNSALFVDTLLGTNELSFRFQSHEQYDWYFKLKEGTFKNSILNLKVKMEVVCMVFMLRSEYLHFLDRSGQGLPLNVLLMELVSCYRILSCPPFPNSREEYVSAEVVLFYCLYSVLYFLVDRREFSYVCVIYVQKISPNAGPNNLYAVEEVEKIKNMLARLQENDGGIAKATTVIVKSVIKIIDYPLEFPDFPARRFLFEGLNSDAKARLMSYLSETLGNSFFKYIKLDSNCNTEEIKNFFIEALKESPCMVLLFDGVEFADAELYRHLLEILDKGILEDSEGFSVDFRRTVIILTSEVADKHRLANWFGYQPMYMLHMDKSQKVKRYRTELLHRADEIIFFDPVAPVHGKIRRIPKSYLRSLKRKDNSRLFRCLYSAVWPHGDVMLNRERNFVEM
ncbi:PREDICTED: uncharacterized protein LOC105962011 isoform X2 [Erythranthe guttata]|uniref:uncharacterized protein LOC105962011 isoform X2 n=1 Tax=Erythranthe guttata TaxID=4155 RepID=UPI00064DF89C|nr:PREDICTED: uncharacterized protein LOC105962011 isoform X2 [Erythranthe guttata]|eukprot:XP_012841729.1 PREDICTED: uncharacterized protein LOC105962011 isoform X2 [Erythranthe guttata]